MNVIFALVLFLILASIAIIGVIWLVQKALVMLVGKGSDPLPTSIEEARPGTMLLHTSDGGAEYTEALTYDGSPETYFMEQRAANYMQDNKYTFIEFKDAEGKTHRYDRAGLQQKGWSIN